MRLRALQRAATELGIRALYRRRVALARERRFYGLSRRAHASLLAVESGINLLEWLKSLGC